jgi:hypothetical protein
VKPTIVLEPAAAELGLGETWAAAAGTMARAATEATAKMDLRI